MTSTSFFKDALQGLNSVESAAAHVDHAYGPTQKNKDALISEGQLSRPADQFAFSTYAEQRLRLQDLLLDTCFAAGMAMPDSSPSQRPSQIENSA